MENWKKRDRGEKVYAEKDESWHLTGDEIPANDQDIAKLLKEQKRKDADLAAFGQKMHSRHSAEWKAYSADYRDTKAQIWDREKGRTAFKRAREDVMSQFKPLRSQLAKQQYAEKRAFEAKETRVGGKLENAMAAVRHARLSEPDSSRGFMSMAFNFLTSKKARGDALDQLHRAQWRNLRSAEKAQIDQAIHKLKTDQQTALASFRRAFASRRQSLKDAQDAQRADLQRKWRQGKQERDRVAEVARTMESVKRDATASPEASRGQKREEYNRAARASRKGRRSRKRKPDD